MTADPKTIPQARKIDRLSYYEAAELSYFGAKILHPRTLEPLDGMKIAVRIKSLLDPNGSGTEICSEGCENEDVVKSVTADDAIAVLRIHGPGVGYRPGVIGRIGRRLSDKGVNIHAIITAQTCINLLLDKKDARESYDALRDLDVGVMSRLDLEEDIMLIAVVGDGLLNRKGVAARIFSSISRAGVNVEMISTGASEAASYFIVRDSDGEKAIKALHHEFFETLR
jgi:aspartate kinase